MKKQDLKPCRWIPLQKRSLGLYKPYDMLPSMMCWYEFEGFAASNTELKDWVNSGITTNPAGLITTCVDFGGNGGYSRTDTDSTPVTGANKTICGWFKINAVNANFTILNATGNGGVDWIMRLHYDTASGKVKLTVDGQTVTHPLTYSTADWNFFAIRFNGTTNTFRLSIGTVANQVSLVKAPIASAIPYGIDLGWDSGNGYANLMMDQLGVWEYEQSDVGLLWLRNNGKGRTYAEL